MAGRPRTMAKRVGELEIHALDVAGHVFHACPEQYRGSSEPDDALGALWWAAVNASMRSSIAVEKLGDALRTKAGVTGPSESERFLNEMIAKERAAAEGDAEHPPKDNST